MKHNNFVCKRCNNLFFYSPDYRSSEVLCEDCRDNHNNWFWKLLRWFK